MYLFFLSCSLRMLSSAVQALLTTLHHHISIGKPHQAMTDSGAGRRGSGSTGRGGTGHGRGRGGGRGGRSSSSWENPFTQPAEPPSRSLQNPLQTLPVVYVRGGNMSKRVRLMGKATVWDEIILIAQIHPTITNEHEVDVVYNGGRVGTMFVPTALMPYMVQGDIYIVGVCYDWYDLNADLHVIGTVVVAVNGWLGPSTPLQAMIHSWDEMILEPAADAELVSEPNSEDSLAAATLQLQGNTYDADSQATRCPEEDDHVSDADSESSY